MRYFTCFFNKVILLSNYLWYMTFRLFSVTSQSDRPTRGNESPAVSLFLLLKPMILLKHHVGTVSGNDAKMMFSKCFVISSLLK